MFRAWQKAYSLGLMIVLGAVVSVEAQDRGGFGGRSREGFGRGDYRGRSEQRGSEDRGRSEQRGSEGWGRGDSRSEGRGSFDPRGFLQRLDRNGNGVLDPDEVDGRSQRFIERAAQNAGLELGKPMPIDKLAEGFSVQRRPEGESSSSGSSSNSGSGSSTRSSESPRVPGFGVNTNLQKPPGFDVPLQTARVENRSGGGGGSGSASSGGSSSQGGSSDNSDAAKVRRYAESLLRQYDENKNGVLERDEWSKMRGDPAKADQNNDGTITLDELSDRLANYGSQSSDSGSSSSPSSGPPSGDWRSRGGDRGSYGDARRGPSSSTSAERSTSSIKSYRALTPLERLPKGLPTWFSRNDADLDGQITMAEYSTTWNDSTASEFASYDLNGDGVITAEECLAAEKLKMAKK